MRAVVYEAFGRLAQVRDVAVPACPADGALIRVEATGVCRSDWHAWQGHDDDIVLPHIPGHEFAGVVEEVGSAASRSWLGRRVTVPFVCACGACAQCDEGNQQVCPNQAQPGFTHHGSFAEFVTIRYADVNLVALPDEIDSVTAAGLGCRFATAYRAAVSHGDVQSGQWVAVHGCGGVGLAAIMIAASRGARVIAVDVHADALHRAVELGAEHAVQPPSADRVIALSGGGVNVSIEAIGLASTFADSLAGLRRRGRHVQVGLLLAGEARPAVDMAAVIGRELEIVGSHGMSARDYPQLLHEIATGKLRPDQLVGRVLNLDEAPSALAGIDSAIRSGTTVVRLQ